MAKLELIEEFDAARQRKYYHIHLDGERLKLFSDSEKDEAYYFFDNFKQKESIKKTLKTKEI